MGRQGVKAPMGTGGVCVCVCLSLVQVDSIVNGGRYTMQ